MTLAHNVRERKEVSEVLGLAAASGGKIIKPAQDVVWGGHSGYFADPDGHLWEVCWNPMPEGRSINLAIFDIDGTLTESVAGKPGFRAGSSLAKLLAAHRGRQ